MNTVEKITNVLLDIFDGTAERTATEMAISENKEKIVAARAELEALTKQNAELEEFIAEKCNPRELSETLSDYFTGKMHENTFDMISGMYKNDFENFLDPLVKVAARILVDAIESLEQETEFLEDGLKKLNDLRQYITPTRREEVKDVVQNMIVEQMRKFEDKTVYLITDDKGVAVGLFKEICEVVGVLNDGSDRSPIPGGKLEMLVTPEEVVVFDGEDEFSLDLDDNTAVKREKEPIDRDRG